MWLLVVNQNAGKKRGLALAEEFSKLIELSNQKFQLINERGAGATDQALASHLKTGQFSKVIAFGGDGLVNLCIQRTMSTGASLGVVAAGTGNDFSRTTGAHKKSVKQLFDIYSKVPTSTIDIGRISAKNHDTYYVQVLSTGFDAMVNSYANGLKWSKGKLKYTLAMLFTLKQFRPIDYIFEIDGRKFLKKAMLLSIANGFCYGGGMKINPHASNNDGLLNVLIVEPVSKVKLLALFPRIFTGSHIKHPKVSTFSGKVISVEAQTDCYADGEFISTLPIQVSVLPGALRTWVLK
jgi:diacylglycerol kinase (ATP)